MRKIRYKETTQELDKLVAPNFQGLNRSSVGMDSFVGEYYQIHVDKLIPYRNQAREVFNEEELSNLCDTIKAHGVRQPLTIIKSDLQEGKFEVVSGERRLRAARLAGFDKVPCIILKNIEQAEEIALIENIQRSDLHPIELGRSLKQLIQKQGWGGQKDLSKKIGLSSSQISELVKLTELSERVQKEALKNNFRGRENFRKLFSLPDEDQRLAYIQKICGVSTKINSPFKTKSIIRISYRDDELKIQKKSLKSLPPHKKEEIKKLLSSIIEELGESHNAPAKPGA